MPAAILGLLLDNFLTEHLYNYITVAITLVVYGILFIVIENRNKTHNPKITSLDNISYETALLIGAFQVLPLIPGTSRSGATILGAIILGCSRFVAAEFSFFLAVPVMFGASALKLVKYEFNYTGQEIIVLLTGMIVAFAVSLFAIKLLMKFIQKHDFKVFGYYRIALGILVVIFFAIFM